MARNIYLHKTDSRLASRFALLCFVLKVNPDVHTYFSVPTYITNFLGHSVLNTYCMQINAFLSTIASAVGFLRSSQRWWELLRNM